MQYKKIISSIIIAFLLIGYIPTRAIETSPPTTSMAPSAKAAILIEQSSGKVLFEKSPDEHLPIASVTKVMTMLLATEAIDNGVLSENDTITASAYASSMGGSQVYLQQGEQMNVRDILKAIAVSSGNDASVALAEHLAGSEPVFVEQMNQRARELGMNNTNFVNCNGLGEGTEGYSCARDVATMSAELIKHPKIHDYLTIWMDSLRDGAFGLSNTNRLIRFYNGANGIKTGSTSEAGYCLSASAKRDNMQLIAVVLGAPSTDERFSEATALLDHGFATYAVLKTEQGNLGEVVVTKGEIERLPVSESQASGVVVPKASLNKIKKEVDLPERVSAPIEVGQKIGETRYMLDGQPLAQVDIVADVPSEKIGFFKFFARIFGKLATFA